jgi:transposase
MPRTSALKKTVHASEQDRPDVARRRLQWRSYQTRIEPDRLAFIDETWTKTNMAPLRGWSPCGARLLSKVPYGHWNTMTFIAALRHDRIEAPWLLDGPINGESFRIYVEKVLVPTLHTGDLVIMDNLGSHKSPAVRQAIRDAGARLFLLPKYSPDLNPIEQVFAKLKHLLRKAAARTRETVSASIGKLLDTYTPGECANYFSNSGYIKPNPITL